MALTLTSLDPSYSISDMGKPLYQGEIYYE